MEVALYSWYGPYYLVAKCHSTKALLHGAVRHRLGLFRDERYDGAGGGEHAADAVADRDLAPGIWAGADPRIRQSRPMLGPGDKRLPQPHQLLMISALASNG